MEPASRGNRAFMRQAISLLLFVAIVIGLFFLSIVKENLGLDARPVAYGATFSKPYAESMGLDWRAAYLASLDDLGLRRFRIPAYWDGIEKTEGKRDYRDLDWMLSEAEKRGARVILAVGRKVPRWPECHEPDWAKSLPEEEIRAKTLEFVEATVRRYAAHRAVAAWQVENEPLFDFGECPPPDKDFLKKEIELVRSLDSRPIVVTESGELSTWTGAAGLADIVGISTYRSVWNRYIGYFYWPTGPAYYHARYDAIAPLVDGVIVTELQAEPWVTRAIADVPPDEQRALMNPVRLRENADFARRIGFPEVYLWGIEWWYWAKEHGRPEMWEAGRELIQAARLERGLGL